MEEMFNKWAGTIPAEIRAEVIAKLQRCEGTEAVLALAETYHLPMTEKVAGVLALYISDPKLLNEEDLNGIAGGTLCPTEGCATYNCKPTWDCPTWDCTHDCSSGA